MLALIEEDPHRASHRDTTREASALPASQDTSHVVSAKIHEEDVRPELKFPRRRLQGGYDVQDAVVARFG
jgi:hypothetical protein